MLRDEILPEILAAAGVSAEFCARPEVWPAFEEWLRQLRDRAYVELRNDDR